MTVTTGVVYGTGSVQQPAVGDKPLLLDLYQPTGADLPARLPGLVIIHGGGFTGGSRAQSELVEIANGLASRGYVVASIDYRLERDDPLASSRMQPLADALGGPSAAPWLRAIVAATDDTLTAFDWLQANADDLALDLGRVAVLGGSAGAITALHAAYLLDEWSIPAPPIAAVVEFWGALFLSVSDPTPLEAGEPPLFAVHGDADTVVAFSWSEILVERAEAVGVPVEWHPIAGGGHGFGNVDVMTVEVSPGVTLFDRMVAFLHAALHTPGCLARTDPVAAVNVVDADGDAIGNVCDGDFNQDGFVGGPDFDVMLACFDRAVGAGVGPPTDPTCAESDMNGDGFVGGPDFDLFLQVFDGPPG